jgi:hypothetical protein
MSVELKRPPLIGSNDFIDAVAKLKSPIVDGNGGFLPGNKPAIDERYIRHINS